MGSDPKDMSTEFGVLKCVNLRVILPCVSVSKSSSNSRGVFLNICDSKPRWKWPLENHIEILHQQIQKWRSPPLDNRKTIFGNIKNFQNYHTSHPLDWEVRNFSLYVLDTHFWWFFACSRLWGNAIKQKGLNFKILSPQNAFFVF